MGLASRRGATAVVIGLLVGSAVLTGDADATTAHIANRAGVVVQHADLGTLTDCVAFHEREINGLELLERSEFDFRAAHFEGIGTGICWIDGEGCKTTDPEECFCTPVRSWSYWVQEKGEPVFGHGETYADGRKIRDGSIDYWTFGPHGTPPATVFSIDEICGNEGALTADPADAVGRVQDLDTFSAQAIADRVGLAEVFLRPRVLALVEECEKLGG